MPPTLPQTGYYTDVEWCTAFDETLKNFRRKLTDTNCPTIRWGNTWIVRAEDLYATLTHGQRPPPPRYPRLRDAG